MVVFTCWNVSADAAIVTDADLVASGKAVCKFCRTSALFAGKNGRPIQIDTKFILPPPHFLFFCFVLLPVTFKYRTYQSSVGLSVWPAQFLPALRSQQRKCHKRHQNRAKISTVFAVSIRLFPATNVHEERKRSKQTVCK